MYEKGQLFCFKSVLCEDKKAVANYYAVTEVECFSVSRE